MAPSPVEIPAGALPRPAGPDPRGRLRAVETLAPVRMQRLTAAVPWALVGLILLLGVLLGDSVTYQVIGFGGAAALGTIAVRAARLRLVLGDDVVAVGWVNSQRLPWSEIEKFVVNEKGLAIRMRGGLEETVPAFQMGGWTLRSTREAMQTRLTEVCARAEEHRRSRRGKK